MIGRLSARGLAAATAACAAGGLALAASPAAASDLSYSAGAFGTFLNVAGDPDDDNVDISLAGNTVTVTDTGTGGITTADTDCAPAGPTAVTCPFDPPDPPPPADPTEPVESASVSLEGANDGLTSSVPFTVSVSGGNGDDTLQGGPADDFLGGELGNDTALGGDGDDTLDGGGSGFAAGGADHLDGQNGVDRIEYERDAAVSVSVNGQPDDGFPGEGDNVNVEDVTTGRGADVLIGNAQANLLSGGIGDDLISGLEGNDVLLGGVGEDGLIGGAQRDQLACSDGFDTGIVDARDQVGADCERTGAEVRGGTALVNRKGRTRVPVDCPLAEANQCAGRLVLLLGTRTLGAGAFTIGAGLTRRVAVRLTKQGRKALEDSEGALIAVAQAETTEPIGTSVKLDEVLLRQKPRRGGNGR